MAINFPTNPSNGDAHAGFIYNSTKNVWEASAASVPMSDTPPANPAQGDLWFDSSVAKTYIYYNDGSSSQWVQLNPSGGSDGADATGDGESPVIYTEPATTHTLNNDGSTSTIQMQAVDPEGTAITYGIAYANSTNALPDQLASATTIDQSTGTYTFTPTTTSSNAGSFKARLSASDGVQTSTRFVDFNLAFSLPVDYLVVAGGGGGGNYGGGGGAGGFITGQTTLQMGTSYTITIGDGGAGATSSNDRGTSGDNSVFSSFTAIGGGGGGSNGTSPDAVYIHTGGSGGSGGGESQQNNTSGAPGSGTAGQGNDGGNAYNSTSQHLGGGGGGAGAVGGNASSGVAGSGGVGLTTNLITEAIASSESVGQVSSANIYFSGGGGGQRFTSSGTLGAGGLGGGGRGGSSSSGIAAISGSPNSGGGGGAGYNDINGAGGSGVVILRFNNPAPTISAGLSYSTATIGNDTVLIFKSGTGTVTF